VRTWLWGFFHPKCGSLSFTLNLDCLLSDASTDSEERRAVRFVSIFFDEGQYFQRGIQ
jgi:hypothetical protein